MNLKNHANLLILIISGLVFFFIYSLLPGSQLLNNIKNDYNLNYKFNTPDEVINYYFSVSYAQTGNLYYLEPLNVFMHRVIFPRWALVVGNKITPGNFLGLDLIFGSVAKVFGLGIIPFLTPLFAFGLVLFCYFLFRLFWSEKIAFLSCLLIYIFPPFWYYASRTLFPNILFLFCLIAALYFFIKLISGENFDANRKNVFLSVLGGLFLGAALIGRTSEIVWLFFLFLLLLIFWHPPLKKVYPFLLLIIFVAALCFVPVFYHHKILYDNYFSTGYPLDTVSNNLETNTISQIAWLKALFLPFGLHLKNIILVIYHYLLKMLWSWFIFWLIGFVFFIKNKPSLKEKKFLILSLVPSYLLIYYGSWQFYDATVPGLISLGSSYVRYFLPLFIFNLPFVAWLLFFVKAKIKNKYLSFSFIFLVIICLFFWSLNLVWFKGPESLSPLKKQLLISQTLAVEVVKNTKPHDLILVSASADKIIFPEHQRLIVPQNGVEWPEIRRLLAVTSNSNVYYFTPENSDVMELNEQIFKPQNLNLINPVYLSQGFLAQIKLIK
ncbi:MAG TPA: hypothetical protein PKZ16_01420 [bacterium]|nr:hypothetical protein [bacterium]HPL95213.1 hypothetical protein [bacterium]